MTLALGGCSLFHQHAWRKATCTEPKTCIYCGETMGEPLGHSWKDATCTEPRTCTVCGATKGDPLEHTFADATCTEPRTCTVCGATDGEALGHDGVWKTTSVNIVTATRSMRQVCSRCGKELDSKTEEVDTFVDGKVFTFTPEEVVTRLQNAWDSQKQDVFVLKFEYSVNSKGWANFDFYNKNHVWLGWGLFYDVNGQAIEASNVNAQIASVRIIAGPVSDFKEDTLFYLDEQLLGPCASAVDPTIKKGDVYTDPIEENLYSMTDGKSLNGLFYTCSYNKEKGYFYMDVDIDAAETQTYL